MSVSVSLLQREAAELHPAYFALVMATGIVSIASHLLGMTFISWPLLAINVVAYIVLWLFFLTRLLRYPDRLLHDLASHTLGPGFLTMVAGTCVLGSQLIVVLQDFAVARVLWFVGIALWLLLFYAFFSMVTLKEQKPPLEAGVNGAWLLMVVSTQSVAVLGGLLVARFPGSEGPVLFFSLCMYLLSCMLYILIITLIFSRFMFFKVNPNDLTPPYWINMGAVAITTLAGAVLMLNAEQWPPLVELVPFIKGFTLFFWATGTWWIPLLLIFGGWRHIYKRLPLTYHPLYWGLVFPLGMYTTCTLRLIQATGYDFLAWIPHVFIYLAIIAWALTFYGMSRRLLGKLIAEGREPKPAR
ncbi:MAG: putative membrane protein [Chloroflexi bacterium ADurb.Bin325]|nr:MAG: putative membrane protein [Chloroflexi bacterium ADurb.Bin325]